LIAVTLAKNAKNEASVKTVVDTYNIQRETLRQCMRGRAIELCEFVLLLIVNMVAMLVSGGECYAYYG
jgi:hypothetical protein